MGWVLLVSLTGTAACSACADPVPKPLQLAPAALPSQSARTSSDDAPHLLPERCENRKAAAECFPPGQVNAALTAIWPSVLLCLPPRSPDPEDNVPSTAVLRLQFDADGGIRDLAVEKESDFLDARVAACAARAARGIGLRPTCSGRFRCTLKVTHGF